MDQSFWDQNGDWISAAITMALTIAIAIVVDRYVLAHAGRYATRVADVSRPPTPACAWSAASSSS